MLDELISPRYRDEQVRLHAQPRGYGQRGSKWSTHVNTLVWKHGCQSVLDYGCGQGSLRQWVAEAGRCRDIREYDPAIAGKDALPAVADLVVCTDVLEHVEPDKIDAVLAHLRSVTGRLLFVVISLVETAKTLSDGRQAHILLQAPAWWRARFEALGFAVIEELSIKPEKQWVAVLAADEARG